MTWENEEWSGNQYFWKIRAIALCDSSGWFFEAINCMRDGSMGKKDSNGVYERTWFGDSIFADELSTLRPATREEVELYLEYVSLSAAIGDCYGDGADVRVITKDYGKYISSVVFEYVNPPLWKRIINKFRKEKLPF